MSLPPIVRYTIATSYSLSKPVVVDVNLSPDSDHTGIDSKTVNCNYLRH